MLMRYLRLVVMVALLCPAFLAGEAGAQTRDAKLEEISSLMFAAGNSNFILVELINDGLLMTEQAYQLEHFPAGRVMLNGRGVPAPYGERYKSLIALFNNQTGKAGSIISMRGDGISMRDILDANSSFRQPGVVRQTRRQLGLGVNRLDASIDDDRGKALIAEMLKDGLVDTSKPTRIYYSKKGLFVNDQLLSGRLAAKYKNRFVELYGFIPQKDGDSYSIRQH
jgi:hypothetical protein